MDEKMKQLQAKIAGDAGFVEKLFALETAEEVQALLKAEGIEFSVDEITQIKDMLASVIEKKDGGELSDEDLEEVAGGVSVTAAVAIIGAVAGGVTAAAGATDMAVRSRW